MSQQTQANFCAIVSTTIALPSVLALHDISQEFWDSLEDSEQDKLIAEFLEHSGLGEGIRIRSKTTVSAYGKPSWDLPETILSAISQAATAAQMTESEVVEEVLGNWAGI